MRIFRRCLFTVVLLGLFLTNYSGPRVQTSLASICEPGTGWKWVNGPVRPDIAEQAQQALAAAGTPFTVQAWGYGEEDLCGNYRPYGVDFTLITANSDSTSILTDKTMQTKVSQVLSHLQEANVGQIRIKTPQGETFALLDRDISPTMMKSEPRQSNQMASASAAGTVYSRNVLVVAYDPYVDANQTQRLYDYMHWNSYTEITNQTIAFFKTNSNGRMRFNVVETKVINEFPVKADGFTYTISNYLAVMNHTVEGHQPDGVDYNKIVNDPRLDICGKANRGEIDEVWVFNGPYFGFWESTLVGPGSYFFNSPSVPGPYDCNRMIPIMGPSPERWISEFVEDFGHRTESTMKQVYGGQWDQNNTRNDWEKFALVKSQSPNYSYSGCGDVHYPPNGQSDYDWSNQSTANSNCADFANYPNLHNPLEVLQPVTCSDWGCSGLGFFGWWYSRFPAFNGCGLDGVAYDWWAYFARPEFALNPIKGCETYRGYLPAIQSAK